MHPEVRILQVPSGVKGTASLWRITWRLAVEISCAIIPFE
jgi:hypothetical protein